MKRSKNPRLPHSKSPNRRLLTNFGGIKITEEHRTKEQEWKEKRIAARLSPEEVAIYREMEQNVSPVREEQLRKRLKETRQKEKRGKQAINRDLLCVEDQLGTLASSESYKREFHERKVLLDIRRNLETKYVVLLSDAERLTTLTERLTATRTEIGETLKRRGNELKEIQGNLRKIDANLKDLKWAREMKRLKQQRAALLREKECFKGQK